MTVCPVCQSFSSDDHEAVEDHIDICLVASCRPLAPSIKAPPPLPSTSSPAHFTLDSDDDLLLEREDDCHDRSTKAQPPFPSSTCPPSTSSPSSDPSPPTSLTPLLPRIPTPGLNLAPSALLVLSDDEEVEEAEKSIKRQKVEGPPPPPLPSAVSTKPSRSLTFPSSSLSSSSASLGPPKLKRSLVEPKPSDFSQPLLTLSEEKEEEVEGVKAVKESKRESKEERKEVSPPISSGGGMMLEVIEIDELSEASQSSRVVDVEEELKEEKRPSRDGRSSHSHSASFSPDLPNRSVSLVRQFKPLPFEDVDVTYLDEDLSQQVVDELEEEHWVMSHQDTFEAAMAQASSHLRRLIQEAAFSSISSSSSTSLPPSSSKSLPAILDILTSAHEASLLSQRLHYQERMGELQRRLSDVKQRAKAQLLGMKEDVERRLSVMNAVMLEHDRKHQRELEEELTRIRIEEWKARDEEMLALRKEKRNEQEQVQQEQATLQAKLKESTHVILDEEKAAMDAGTFARIQLRPSRHFEGLTGQEFHFRLAESQFLRMCGSHLAGQYRVTLVELIVNPPLRARYDAFVQEERKKSGGQITPPEHLTFHGTSSAAVEKIIQEGFRIGGVDTPMATAAALGHGIYSSEDPGFACGYIKDGRTQLLFSRVCPSSDSVISKGPDGVIQQLVVKNRDQILPLYIVHFARHNASGDGVGMPFMGFMGRMGPASFINAMNAAKQISGGAYPPSSSPSAPVPYVSRRPRSSRRSQKHTPSSGPIPQLPPPSSSGSSPMVVPPGSNYPSSPMLSPSSYYSSSPSIFSSPFSSFNGPSPPVPQQPPHSPTGLSPLSAHQQQMLSLYSPQVLSTTPISSPTPPSHQSRPRSKR